MYCIHKHFFRPRPYAGRTSGGTDGGSWRRAGPPDAAPASTVSYLFCHRHTSTAGHLSSSYVLCWTSFIVIRPLLHRHTSSAGHLSSSYILCWTTVIVIRPSYILPSGSWLPLENVTPQWLLVLRAIWPTNCHSR